MKRIVDFQAFWQDAKRSLRSVLPFLLLSATSVSLSQTGTTASTPLQSAQTQAWSSMMGTNHPTSITLDGTFTSTEGSLRQNGTFEMTVGSDGSYSIGLSRTVGTTNESRTVANGTPACTWTDQDNVVHNSLFLNCVPPPWFFPGLSLLSQTGDPSHPAWAPTSYTVDSMGDHLSFQFVFPNTTAAQEDPQLATPLDLVLAPDTHLPLFVLFTAHPDNGWTHADIPVKIAYSDYRGVSGVMIPFRIQRYLNGSLILDLTITSASVQ